MPAVAIELSDLERGEFVGLSRASRTSRSPNRGGRTRRSASGVAGSPSIGSRGATTSPVAARRGRSATTRDRPDDPPDATHWSSRGTGRAAGEAPSPVHRIWQAFGLQPHRAETLQAVQRPVLRGQGARHHAGLRTAHLRPFPRVAGGDPCPGNSRRGSRHCSRHCSRPRDRSVPSQPRRPVPAAVPSGEPALITTALAFLCRRVKEREDEGEMMMSI